MTSLLTPRPPASGSPLVRPPRRRRRLRRRLLALAAVPVALLLGVVLVVVTLFGSGLGGPPGGGFGGLAFNPDSSAPIVVHDPALAGLNQEQLHNAAKIIAAGMALTAQGTALGGTPSGG